MHQAVNDTPTIIWPIFCTLSLRTCMLNGMAAWIIFNTESSRKRRDQLGIHVSEVPQAIQRCSRRQYLTPRASTNYMYIDILQLVAAATRKLFLHASSSKRYAHNNMAIVHIVSTSLASACL